MQAIERPEVRRLSDGQRQSDLDIEVNGIGMRAFFDAKGDVEGEWRRALTICQTG